MLVGEREETPLTVIMAIEDDAALAFGQRAIAAFRNAGLSADMIASGSPRKRFDKAAKVPAKVLVAVNMRDGVSVANLRSAERSEEYLAVEQVIQSLSS